MKLYRASARALVERELTRNSLPCQDDNNKKLYRASARALVERELTRNSLPCQDDNNKKLYRASARALVARNFFGIHFRKKGTIK